MFARFHLASANSEMLNGALAGNRKDMTLSQWGTASDSVLKSRSLPTSAHQITHNTRLHAIDDHIVYWPQLVRQPFYTPKDHLPRLVKASDTQPTLAF